jgi:hypothetical protein
MPALTPPKRTSAGYYVALSSPVKAPALRWANGVWTHTAEWSAWATQQRSQVLDELLANPKWFSRPPRRDILEPIFGPWDARNMQGTWLFACKVPDVPGDEDSKGSAVWHLQGVIMSSSSITPVWALTDVVVDPQQDTISLFGDGGSEMGDGDTVDAGDEETREIQLDDLEEAPAAATPMRIRTREWETRKFLAKERVREARLKAQIAVRLANKEESRYYTQFGDLDETESHFSDYDLTEDESSGSEGEDASTVNE